MEWDAFLKIIDLIMIEGIGVFTNMYIGQLRTVHVTEKKTVWKQIVFCTWLSDHANLTEIWTDEETGIDICREIICYKRLTFVAHCLKFDDKPTRVGRRRVDRLVAIRSFLEAIVHKTKTWEVIDEMFYTFRGRCTGYKIFLANQQNTGSKGRDCKMLKLFILPIWKFTEEKSQMFNNPCQTLLLTLWSY